MQSVSTSNCVSAATSRKPSCVESRKRANFFFLQAVAFAATLDNQPKESRVAAVLVRLYLQWRLSLSFSLPATRTHTQTHSYSLFFSHSATNTHTLSLSHSFLSHQALLSPCCCHRHSWESGEFSKVFLLWSNSDVSHLRRRNRIIAFFQVRLDFCSMTVEPDKSWFKAEPVSLELQLWARTLKPVRVF